MGKFHGSVYRKESDGFSTGMLFLPVAHARKREVLQHFIGTIERSFESIHVNNDWPAQAKWL